MRLGVLLLNRGLQLRAGSSGRCVATGVFSRMNSPGWTSRSETEPATGARMTASATFFCASSHDARRSCRLRLQAVDGVERGLIVRLGDLQRASRRCRDRPASAGRGRSAAAPARTRCARRRGSRVAWRDRRDLLVGRRLLVLRGDRCRAALRPGAARSRRGRAPAAARAARAGRARRRL